MKYIRIGVIGIGNMGSIHARYLLDERIKRAKLTAVCDSDSARFDLFPGVKNFVGSKDLIQSGLVDAVLIATPHYAHTTIGVDALRQGLHVLIEKPISVHKADCQRLIAAYRKRPRQKQVFAAMFNQRTNPYLIKLRQLVRVGMLGSLRRIAWTTTAWYRTETYYATGDWRATWAGEGGGVLLNQAMHDLDMFQWIVGMPARVRAVCQMGRYHDIETEDDVTAFLEYANGATAVFTASTGEAPGTSRIEIVGEKGRAVLENDLLTLKLNKKPMTLFSRLSSKCYEMPPSTTKTFQFKDHGGQHVEMIKNFTEAILDGRPLIAPAEEGLHAVELANAMLLSTFENRTVSLPINASVYARHLQELRTKTHFAKRLLQKKNGEIPPYLV